MAVLQQFEWIVVVGSFAAFLFGFGTGSNDVANAFGTSVGAKTLTLRQAVVIAAIFEFTGAMVLGRVSTSTIAGGIADISAFQREPEMYAYGMMCSLFVAGTWQILSSYMELNTSSTHSIIGCIIGFSLAYGGPGAVLWNVEDPASFPPYKGVVPIILSWFFGPILTGLCAAVFFLICRHAILRHKNAYKISFWVLPPMVAFTVFICLYFIFTKGAKKTLQGDQGDDWTDGKAAWIAACAGIGAGVIVATCLVPYMIWRMNQRFTEAKTNDEMAMSEMEAQQASDKSAVKVMTSAEDGSDESPAEGLAEGGNKLMITAKGWLNKSFKAMAHGTNVDIHAVVEEDELVGGIHKNAEAFDPKAEFVFSYLQVFSACCVMLAHGAGEVGYMAGPLATIYTVYEDGVLTKNVTATAWVVLIGAIGLVIGLATYGYNVCRAMGVRLAKLSPSRGFCAELATACIIMVASQYGLPMSSSQSVTGGIIGVGLCEGARMGINWKFFARQFGSWIATIFICGIGTAAIYAQGVYAPSVNYGNEVIYYEDVITGLSTNLLNQMNSLAKAYNASAQAGALASLSGADVNKLSAILTAMSKNATSLNTTTVQSADRHEIVEYLYKSLALYQNNTILTFGQNRVYPQVPLCNSNNTADILNNVSVPCGSPMLLPKSVKTTFP